MTSREYAEVAAKVIDTEIEGLESMKKNLDGSFTKAINIILENPGRIVITGMGKSGLVGQKIAATLASTGSPSFFIHPAEGLHGDLGMLMKGDTVVAISNSGETEELLRVLPVIKRMDLKMIAMCGKENSSLVKASDAFLDISVPAEACPLGLAPTSSTTATLVMGDCMAVALLTKKGFKAEDFALFHPAGSLGKRLLLKVADIMNAGDSMPLCSPDTSVTDAIFEITAKKMGCTGVVNDKGELIGIFTDGDLRRLLRVSGQESLNFKLGDVMTSNPSRVLADNLAAKAMNTMEQNTITSLFVFHDDEAKKPIGIIHIHDLLKAGVS